MPLVVISSVPIRPFWSDPQPLGSDASNPSSPLQLAKGGGERRHGMAKQAAPR